MSISSKIESLITAANSVTGESRTDLTSAVQDLKDGYGGGGGLPAEYEAVEYIESTGTQYIDTGHIASDGTNIECEVYIPINTPTYYCVFGSWTSSYAFQLMGQDGGNKFSYYVGNGAFAAYGAYDKKIKIMTNNAGLQFEDFSTYNYIARSGTHRTDYSLGIFAGHESGGFNAGTLMRCYYFKIFENGNLVRNFVPCIRKADDEAGLYDLVNGVFYTNAGTGDFVVPT